MNVRTHAAPPSWGRNAARAAGIVGFACLATSGALAAPVAFALSAPMVGVGALAVAAVALAGLAVVACRTGQPAEPDTGRGFWLER